MADSIGKAKVPEDSYTRIESERKQPLYARFMDSTLNVTIMEEIKAPLQAGTFDSGDSASQEQRDSSDAPERSK